MTVKGKVLMSSITEETKVTISLYTSIALIVAVVGLAVAVGAWKAGLERSIVSVDEIARHNYEIIEQHEKRFDSQDVTLAKIETDVTWIRYEMEKAENE